MNNEISEKKQKLGLIENKSGKLSTSNHFSESSAKVII